MIEAGKHYLDCAGKDREGAALLLARLLTRYVNGMNIQFV